MAASFRWLLQLHKDVPKAARFYSEGLDFSINVCTHRWAELQSGPLKLALMHSSSDIVVQKGYSSLMSFTVDDINNSVTKLLALGAELDGPIKYEIHGKVRGWAYVGSLSAILRHPSNNHLQVIEIVASVTRQIGCWMQILHWGVVEREN